MAKFTSTAVLDAALAKSATCTRESVCTTQPANFAGISAVSLGNVVVVAGLGGTGYSAALAGDVSGRKTTVAAKTIASASASGSAQHIVLDDGTTLHHVTTCSAQTITAGNQINIPAWDVEFADVTP
jgi:hypothetical protein